MLHLLTSLAETITEPEVVGGLSEFFNSAFAQISAIGVSGMTALGIFLSKIIPSKNFTAGITDKVFKLEDTLKGEITKLQELEVAQKDYQQANDDLLKEIALHSPNAKIKELGKKLEEKKKALTLQQQIQEKVNEKTSEIVSVLKKAK